MRKIFFFIILISLFGCSTSAQIKEIACSDNELIRAENLIRAHQESIEKLNTTINDIEQEKINIDEKLNATLKYINYIGKKTGYNFAPTKCKNPSNYFTMCKDGCYIKFSCDTYSMKPFFDCNAKLTLAECSEYNIGDIILSKNKDEEIGFDFLIHFIIDKEGVAYTTKGYNNGAVDRFKTYKSDILGKVIEIEYR